MDRLKDPQDTAGKRPVTEKEVPAAVREALGNLSLSDMMALRKLSVELAKKQR